MPKEAEEHAKEVNLELSGYGFLNKPEQLRSPRIIRVGAFQNKLPLPPSTPILEQRNALYSLAKNAITCARLAKVNIFCFQEAWSKFLHGFIDLNKY